MVTNDKIENGLSYSDIDQDAGPGGLPRGLGMCGSTVVYTLACLLLSATFGTSQGSTAKDLELLQGTWEIVSMEVEGEKLPPKAIKSMTVQFKTNLMTMGIGAHTETSTFTLDADKNPKWIDATSGATRTGDIVVGIYKIEGDRISLCLSKKRNDRPKVFATNKGSEHGLFIFKKKA
jgi:uncharacterized protein (TIGR03067 family)